MKLPAPSSRARLGALVLNVRRHCMARCTCGEGSSAGAVLPLLVSISQMFGLLQSRSVRRWGNKMFTLWLLGMHVLNQARCRCSLQVNAECRFLALQAPRTHWLACNFHQHHAIFTISASQSGTLTCNGHLRRAEHAGHLLHSRYQQHASGALLNNLQNFLQPTSAAKAFALQGLSGDVAIGQRGGGDSARGRQHGRALPRGHSVRARLQVRLHRLPDLLLLYLSNT